VSILGNDRERYKELGDFLKTRRKRLSPEQVGLPAGQRRRTEGLRREELAQLAGIGVTWYTYLEQGRPIRVSAQVLESLARTLKLDAEERDYLFLLAHQQPPPVSKGYRGEPAQSVAASLQDGSAEPAYALHEGISPTLLRTLDNLGICPAYVLDQCFNVLAWNRSADAVFGDFSKTSGRERNQVWSMFTKPSYRQLYADWESQARSTLAQFRASYAVNIGNEWFKKFIEALMRASPEFKSWWHNHDVQGIVEGDVELNHPKVGYLKLDHISYGVTGNHNLTLRVYTPMPSTDTADKIRQLLDASRYITLVKNQTSPDKNLSSNSIMLQKGTIAKHIEAMNVPQISVDPEKAKSKLHFMAASTSKWVENRDTKAKELFYRAGFDRSIRSGDSVAIKIQFGEWNRSACLRPSDVACIVEEVKKCGGKPFVCDTTTLSYHLFTSRLDELHALKTCYGHGFNQVSCGCPVIVADGWIGHDDVRVEIPEGKILKEAYIGRALASADVLIALTHAKGDPITAFSGAIKNIGVGSQSKRGKYCTHLALWGEPGEAVDWPLVNGQNCGGTSCKWYKLCEDSCPEKAVRITEKGLDFDYNKCRLCFSCQVTCMLVGESAIGFHADFFPYAQIAVADAAKGCLSLFDPAKVNFMTYIQDVVPECDCFPRSGIRIVPDLGIIAGKDIVAVDSATLDLIDEAPNIPGSRAEALGLKPGDDKFKALNLASPRIHLRAAQKLALGSMSYEIDKHESQPPDIDKTLIIPLPPRLTRHKRSSPAGKNISRKAGASKAKFKGSIWEHSK